MNWLPPSIIWNPTNKLFGQFRLMSEHRRAKAAIPTPGSRGIRKLSAATLATESNFRLPGYSPGIADRLAFYRLPADSNCGALGERRVRISRIGGWPKK